MRGLQTSTRPNLLKLKIQENILSMDDDKFDKVQSIPSETSFFLTFNFMDNCSIVNFIECNRLRFKNRAVRFS